MPPRYRSLEIDRERVSLSESCCDTAEEVLQLPLRPVFRFVSVRDFLM
jgi:hypothetical protein